MHEDPKNRDNKDNMLPFAFVTAYLVLHALAAPAPDLMERQSGGCKKIHFIFARGSTESGTMGITVGPAMSKALSSKFGAANVAAEGVQYPADIAGAFSGGTNPSGSAGAIKMTSMAKSILERCPNARVILSGYSQGAEQVHGALFAKNLGEDGARIAVLYHTPS
jgi:cutinase